MRIADFLYFRFWNADFGFYHGMIIAVLKSEMECNGIE